MKKDQSYSNSMSIKDWSAYSNLSSDHKSLVWVWGQSYPWDVILYNQAQGGDNIELPNFVKERLLSENLVLPPSELSLLGLDFTAMASWNITFPEGVKEKETITVSHETANYTASHELAGSDISAKLQSTNEAALASYSSGSLDLGLYSLAPIHGYAAENIATIGFMVNPFSYAPTKDTDPFKIVSPMNDLQATGSGFDSVMTTTFKSKPVITICFKIADSSFNYSLVLAHWLEENSGACIINWTVNDTHKGTMSVSNIKNSEGQNNTNRISLRGTDSSSINFHDYLILGLNKIELEIVPSGEGDHQYTLSSAAIQLL